MALNKSRKIIIIVAVLALVGAVWGYKMYTDSQAIVDANGNSISSSERTSFESGMLNLAELKSTGLPVLINFSGDH